MEKITWHYIVIKDYTLNTYKEVYQHPSEKLEGHFFAVLGGCEKLVEILTNVENSSKSSGNIYEFKYRVYKNYIDLLTHVLILEENKLKMSNKIYPDINVLMTGEEVRDLKFWININKKLKLELQNLNNKNV